MKTRTRKKRNRLFGGFRILVYMNTKKENKKKMHWLSTTRIMVIVWGIIMIIYHIVWIGMAGINSLIQHGIGMIIEYLISGVYENSIVRIDKFINKKTLSSKYRKVKRIIIKYLAFSMIFSITYGIAYTLRMLTIYAIDIHMLTWQQTQTAIINGSIFGITAGPLVGLLVIQARTKKLKIKVIRNKAPV